MANVEKYLPWIIGAIILGVGVYMWRKNQGLTQESYAVIPGADTSGAAQVAAQQQEMMTQAKLAAFGGLTGFLSEKQALAHDTELARQAASVETLRLNNELFALREQNSLQSYLAKLDVDNQKYQANQAYKSERNRQRTQAVTSIFSTVLMAALIFCYDDTEIYFNARQVYRHGIAS